MMVHIYIHTRHSTAQHIYTPHITYIYKLKKKSITVTKVDIHINIYRSLQIKKKEPKRREERKKTTHQRQRRLN